MPVPVQVQVQVQVQVEGRGVKWKRQLMCSKELCQKKTIEANLAV